MLEGIRQWNQHLHQAKGCMENDKGDRKKQKLDTNKASLL